MPGVTCGGGSQRGHARRAASRGRREDDPPRRCIASWGSSDYRTRQAPSPSRTWAATAWYASYRARSSGASNRDWSAAHSAATSLPRTWHGMRGRMADVTQAHLDGRSSQQLQGHSIETGACSPAARGARTPSSRCAAGLPLLQAEGPPGRGVAGPWLHGCMHVLGWHGAGQILVH